MSVAKRVLGWPLRVALNQRIRWINAHVDARTQELRLRLDEGIQESTVRLDELRAIVAQASVERGATEEGIATVLEALRLVEENVADLRPNVEDLVNWANGPEGFAAQAGLWFQPPVGVVVTPAGAQVAVVNERIVEVPYTFAALGSLPKPSRLLDVGGSESTLALSFASMGHHVTVVDPRGYRLVHPNLRAVGCRFDELPDDVAGFDAAIVVSAVEHFGLGHYVPRVGAGEELDSQAVQGLRDRVCTGGLLVLTVPLGEPSVDDFERVYDRAGVQKLLSGWTEMDFQVAWRTSPNVWTLGSPEEPLASKGVALVVARNERR